MVESFETFGLSLFEKYGDSVDEILRLTTDDSRETRALVGPPNISAGKAIASAYLLGDRQVFEETSARAEETLKQSTALDLEDFRLLKAHLEELLAANGN